MYIFQNQTYENLPDRIRLEDGTTRTSLNELSVEQLNSLGVFEYTDTTEAYDENNSYWDNTYIFNHDNKTYIKNIYTDITDSYDTSIEYWDNTYIFDHENKTVIKNILSLAPEVVKQNKLSVLLQEQSVVQQAGFTCTNNIKLQVMEQDLARWTQLMVGLTAFSPATVVVRDYDNVNHTLTLAEATQMLQEVFTWGQWFLQDTWTKKDVILNS